MGRSWWITPEVFEAIAARFRGGERAVVLAVEFGCSPETVWRIAGKDALRRRGPVSSRRLCFADREEISRGIVAGKSDARLGRELGRDRSTIGREIKAGGGRRGYRALSAHRGALRRLARPKATKLSRSPRLLSEVEDGLTRRWSPQQISRRLRCAFPDDVSMQISHETIYQSLFVQGRGELRKQLAHNLRTGRTRRRGQGRADTRGRIVDMVMISERPAEVEDRAVPGHWEGDLIIGAAGKSAIATLVERQTRYVLLAKLPDGRTSEAVIAALQDRIADLPGHLMKSLTWDQGREMAAHRVFTVQTGVPVFFCDPHSPWQRGSNENTNGLLRQYLPRKVDLAARSQIDLDEIAAELNGRPRQTLDWRTPAEKMAQLLGVATTA